MSTVKGTNPCLNTSHEKASSFGEEPLLVLHDGRVIDLATGYIPALVNYTFEDKAAKGLRKRNEAREPEPPIYFTALEVVRDNKVVILSGPSGSGKTTFGKWLCWYLQKSKSSEKRAVIRNELGHTRDESWGVVDVLSWYCDIDCPESLTSLVDYTIPDALRVFEDGKYEAASDRLLVLDHVEYGGADVAIVVNKLIDLLSNQPHIKLLILTDADGKIDSALALEVPKYELLPLLKSQRQQCVSDFMNQGFWPKASMTGSWQTAQNRALFALALYTDHVGDDAEALMDAWLSKVAPDLRQRKDLTAAAFQRLQREASRDPFRSSLAESRSFGAETLLSLAVVQQLLAARHLEQLPPDAVIDIFRQDPQRWAVAMRSLLKRLGDSSKAQLLINGLLQGSRAQAQRGALLIWDSGLVSLSYERRSGALMLQIVEDGVLSVAERELAGRALARMGDPRDLQALVEVPSDEFEMGSNKFPNSQPVHKVYLHEFKISVYPVVNQHYQAFSQETAHAWFSPEAGVPEKRNSPATDLTWHDANAYCSWLTRRWRACGKIAPGEEVRLPTEPEWERAARGDSTASDDGDLIWPWGSSWIDGANFEETTLNRTCSVGLFPQGRSPYGCLDMAGNCWEWCSTLWGVDMATPSLKYPYNAEDGRETAQAQESMRRVLRGGCFSSTRQKLSCSYRGSLEPAGSWRGNGFRIVVAKVAGSQ